MRFVEWLKNRTNGNNINCNNQAPYDSYDRWFTVYLIEKNSDILKINAVEKMKEGDVNFFNYLTDEEKEMFRQESNYAYNNHEREFLNRNEALYHLLKVANQGLEATLTDSYDKGGWFGTASEKTGVSREFVENYLDSIRKIREVKALITDSFASEIIRKNALSDIDGFAKMNKLEEILENIDKEGYDRKLMEFAEESFIKN